MREIKFRAFVLGKMYEVKGLEWTEDGLCLTTGGGFITLPDENAHLREYTGLKDKNGREIYEGDILRWNNGMPEIEIQNGTYIVVWDEAEFNLERTQNTKPTGWGTAYNKYSWKDYMEVIGNIYENPELLEPK